ncbi:helix-turn-helix domain-containing protein [Azorhizobium doebereinerae]|uniref:helix-turn-helix domain-containing protein n=1 Tax=Azorhizobium doebereinerae TaxID=281091 RepID=UPI000424F396|nr:helix-turn-helix domain-containing protein [Azorhizobium doebereinerae]
MHATDEAGDHSTFQAIAHPVRRAILDLLKEGDRTLAQIAGGLGRREAEIEPHLVLLLKAGLLRDKTHAGQLSWSLVPAALGEVDRWLTPYRPFKLVRMADLKRLVEGELRNGR